MSTPEVIQILSNVTIGFVVGFVFGKDKGRKQRCRECKEKK